MATIDSEPFGNLSWIQKCRCGCRDYVRDRVRNPTSICLNIVSLNDTMNPKRRTRSKEVYIGS